MRKQEGRLAGEIRKAELMAMYKVRDPGATIIVHETSSADWNSEDDMSMLPKQFVAFKNKYSDVFNSYEALGNAATEAGPLTAKEIALVRLGIAAGAGLEGAVHAHCRRAVDAGLTPDEIRHAMILCVTTLGFPSMMANLSRVNDLLDAKPGDGDERTAD